MTGGYRTLLDLRPLLLRLEAGQDTPAVWLELWDELHHQGDVGEASFAAVPHLVRIYRNRRALDWNTYAIVAIIELVRNQGKNPDVPKWMEQEYFSAIRELAEIGAAEVLQSGEPETARAILSIIAIATGLRKFGKYLINCSEDELPKVDFLD